MALSEKKPNPALKSLQAFFDEGLDSVLGGYSDELAAAMETPPTQPFSPDQTGYFERYGKALRQKQAARAKMQDEDMLASTLGAITGTYISPIARAATLPARVITTAAEEVGRSDPQSGLDVLKALALGAGQGAVQHFAPKVASHVAATRRRLLKKESIAPLYPKILDVLQSNVSPGMERKIDADRKRREEAEEAERARLVK